MPDILLIQPPIRDFYLTAKRTMPYGLSSIAASLIAAGYSVDIFDALATSKARIRKLPEELSYLQPFYGRADCSPFALFHDFRHFGYSFDTIGKAARESGAFLIGISSLFTPYMREAIRTAEAVKDWHPNCNIVLGGHHPTALPESVMQSSAVDYVIRGEGEVAMPLLADALANGTSLKDIPGLVYRGKKRGIGYRTCGPNAGSGWLSAARPSSGQSQILPAQRDRKYGDCCRPGMSHAMFLLLFWSKFFPGFSQTQRDFHHSRN